MAKPPVDPVLNELLDVARGAATRSRLGIWMTEHLEEMAALVRDYGTDWPRFAEVFIRHGVIEPPPDWDAPGEKGDASRKRAGRAVKQAFHRAQKRSEGKRTKPKAQPAAAPVDQVLGALRGNETPEEAAERRRLAAIKEQKGRSR